MRGATRVLGRLSDISDGWENVMAGEPSVQTNTSGTSLLVHVSGEMDYETAPFFRDHLLDVIAGGQRRVVLDLSAVSFCDSSGLSVLLGAWQQVTGSGAVLVLARVPPRVQRMLQVTGVDAVLHMYGTLAEAEGEQAAGSGA
ncbi:STAS domain-containing protein [Streptomyces sp. ALB3]|uniref:STAS domain-containing protein n=1 Tax=Streptomyces sp. ALB3 TaxID=3374278 RepID=UPI00379A138C